MGYREAMEAAGATVYEFREFGDWQGTWVALVSFNGSMGWVEGAYGSCSGCDAYESEFGYSDSEINFQKKLAAFGLHYLESMAIGDELVEEYRRKVKSTYASGEEKEILEFLIAKSNSIN